MNVSKGNRRKIAVVTGTRAEFGLLLPVMNAIDQHPGLELNVIVAGAHFLPPGETWREVEKVFTPAAKVPMQESGSTGRMHDAVALGRGTAAFAREFERLKPDVVLVLGDRIEAFAAACAASVGGWALAHIHGGDRAEGVADEALRHALTKLAHLHFPATQQSADRIRHMGEPAWRIHLVGSPAMDGLSQVQPLSYHQLAELGFKPREDQPLFLVLHHPAGLGDEYEQATAASVMQAALHLTAPENIFVLQPNHDPGREAVIAGLKQGGATALHPGLPRKVFLAFLKLLALRNGVLIGNSSAGLIEAAALDCPCLNIGPRQRGRERGENVVTVGEGTASHDSSPRETPQSPSRDEIIEGITRVRETAAARSSQNESDDQPLPSHPYGWGDTGKRIAEILASTDLSPALLRKCNSY